MNVYTNIPFKLANKRGMRAGLKTVELCWCCCMDKTLWNTFYYYYF